MVDGVPEVEWVPGFSRRWWSAGLLSIIFGSGFAGVLVAHWFVLWPPPAPSIIATLLTIVYSLAIGLPAFVAYLRIVPTVASLGVTSEGLLVDFGPGSATISAFRQGYRWEGLQRRGRRLLLPRIPKRAPRSLRLTALQLERVGPRIAHG